MSRWKVCLQMSNSSLSLSLSLRQDGVISVKDIDLVMSEGLGMRYAFIGPMETMHLNAPNGKVPSPSFLMLLDA